MKKKKRIHALDALRAIMMLLGIILHASLTYSFWGHEGWPLHSLKDNHIFFDWLFGIIHIFRMPIFFIVSGFFAAFLFYYRSPMLMIKNRVNRILGPFIIFIFLLTPIAILAIKYSKSVLNNSIINKSIVDVLSSIKPFMFIPFSTMHLWFLYYLIMFSFLSFFLAFLFRNRPALLDKIIIGYNYILTNNLLKICSLSMLTFLVLFISDSIWIEASTGFVPHLATFIFYFLFYLFGWILFKSNKLRLYFNHGAWTYTILAIICFTGSFIYYDFIQPQYLMMINAFSTWMFVFGIMAIFLKYINSYNMFMRYLLDASYWIYLVHLPLTMILPGAVDHLSIPVYLKFIIVVLITFTISIVLYHFLVRKTIVGKLLNGKKYL